MVKFAQAAKTSSRKNTKITEESRLILKIFLSGALRPLFASWGVSISDPLPHEFLAR
jgi:hypothetical protein